MNDNGKINPPIVSVVVSVSNNEPWLAECLDSVLHQTISDFEVVCVNDGSTDRSADVLSEYASQDERIRVIELERRGLSETRNSGAHAAQGAYLYFMNGLDKLDPDALESCISVMRQHELECLCFNIIAFGENFECAIEAGEKNRRHFKRTLDDSKVFTGQELLCELAQKDAYISSAASCMLLRSVFLENNLWFHPGIPGEDKAWMFSVLKCISRCGCINRILYRTRICHNNEPELEEKNMFEQMTACPEFLQDMIEEQEKEKADLKKKNNVLVKQNNILKKDKQKLQTQVKTLRRDKKNLKSKINKLKCSESYRIGRLFTWFPRKLKAMIRKLRAVTTRYSSTNVVTKNRITILQSEVSGGRIVYRYELQGNWKKLFRAEKNFAVTYPFDVEKIPESVRIIPLLSLVVPVSWVCDAEVIVPICDRDFEVCLDAVKAGYRKMYPMISFDGQFKAGLIESNSDSESCKKTLVCFSGGVDAFSSTLSHIQEKPLLVSIWGSDVPWEDAEGWKPIETLVQRHAKILGVDSITLRSSFRDILIPKKINEVVSAAGDNWWHGFQHGIGILGHMAPVAFAMNAGKVIIASSFTADDVYTCASDPTIDNHVRFCGAEVVHDGYDLNRQEKVQQIVEYSEANNVEIPLHVCWEKKGGDNCCHCEKCWRTMLGIYAEGADPRRFGFHSYEGPEQFSVDFEKNYVRFMDRLTSHLRPVQNRLRNRIGEENLSEELTWLCNADLRKIEDGTVRLHDCKLKEPVWLIGTPEYNNMGDQCIAESELRFLSTLFRDKHIVEYTDVELRQKQFTQLDEIAPSQTICLQGGGNLGNLWPNFDIFREKIINRLKDNPIIVFPQSIFFTDDEEGQNALAHAKDVYQGDNITICCREKVSYDFAQKHFDCQSILVPDMVMWEAQNPRQPMERYGAMTLLRNDKERKITDEDARVIKNALCRRFCSLEVSDMIHKGGRVNKQNRMYEIDALITRIASAECVITDRLHGMVLCAVTGTPCVVLSNGYHKVDACFEWLKDIGYIQKINEISQLEGAIEAACRCLDRQYPEKKLQKKFEPLAELLKSYNKHITDNGE